tara:strand:+ start:367 stop:627 length:261 start_codon:yes stop_codon:yes gene_type:complete
MSLAIPVTPDMDCFCGKEATTYEGTIPRCTGCYEEWVETVLREWALDGFDFDSWTRPYWIFTQQDAKLLKEHILSSDWYKKLKKNK